MPNSNPTVCVLGLGYVGLPLAVAFAKRGVSTTGYDISTQKITQLQQHIDPTGEVGSEDLKSVSMTFTSDPKTLQKADIIIAAVPTPIDKSRNPDISMLKKACETIGQNLDKTKKQIIVFESTVYPGCTEEDCVPVIEEVAKAKLNKDFYVGYSPERINPGDKKNTVSMIVKVVAGSTPEVADELEALYKRVVDAGIHKARTIKIAEAAKVIENIQRDINIGLINELAQVFDKMDIPTKEVLDAAGTKWNFLPFKPGLVGGHCIGVDPYYLMHKAKEHNHHCDIITAGRRVNDSHVNWVSDSILRLMISQGATPSRSSVLMLGTTFKENVPDTRNSKAIELKEDLERKGISVVALDPYNTTLSVSELVTLKNIQGVVFAVPHKEFESLAFDKLQHIFCEKPFFYDISNTHYHNEVVRNMFAYKSL